MAQPIVRLRIALASDGTDIHDWGDVADGTWKSHQGLGSLVALPTE